MGNDIPKAYSRVEARDTASQEKMEPEAVALQRERELADWKQNMSRVDRAECIKLVHEFNKAMVSDPGRSEVIIYREYVTTAPVFRCFRDTLREAGHPSPREVFELDYSRIICTL